MKICLLSDIHFGIKSDSDHFLNYQIEYFTNQLFPYLQNNNIDTIIHLGDLFNNRKLLNTKTLHIIQNEFFDKIKEYNIKFLTITGNHDCYYSHSNEITSLSFLSKKYDNISVINQNTIIEYDGIKFGLIPWLSNKEDLQNFNNFISQKSPEYLLGHFEFINFEVTKGYIQKHGLNHSDYNTMRKIISGHYHIRQNKDNVLYLGTPYELNWNDYSDKKGFHIFDTKDHSINFVENNIKLYYKIYYNEDKINEINEYVDNIVDGKILKIYIIKKDNIDIFNDFIKKIESKNPFEYQIIESVVNSDKKDSNEQEEINSDETLLQTIDSFLKVKYGEKEKYLFPIMKKMYEEVELE